MNAEQIIRLFRMKPLPAEGGFYVETYRSKESIPADALPERYERQRSLGTSILYLLTADNFSALHRIKSDEIFHFYLGDSVEMLQLHPDGSGEVITLGTDIAAGQRPQVTVPCGTWQGCSLKSGGDYALMGCTVWPGFEFEDYQQGRRESLAKEYPNYRQLIIRLTRS